MKTIVEELIEIVEHEANGAIDTLRHVTALGHIERVLTDAAERIRDLETANALTKRVAELEENYQCLERAYTNICEQAAELQRNALPTNCTHCNGSGVEPPGCPESGPCDRCGGWTAHKRLVAGETTELRKRVAELEAWKTAYLEWQETAARLIESMQSQLAWTPVSEGLPTEPGIYNFYDGAGLEPFWLMHNGSWRDRVEEYVDPAYLRDEQVSYRRIGLPEAT